MYPHPVAESDPSVFSHGFLLDYTSPFKVEGKCEAAWTKHAKQDCDKGRDSKARAMLRGAVIRHVSKVWCVNINKTPEDPGEFPLFVSRRQGDQIPNRLVFETHNLSCDRGETEA